MKRTCEGLFDMKMRVDSCGAQRVVKFFEIIIWKSSADHTDVLIWKMKLQQYWIDYATCWSTREAFVESFSEIEVIDKAAQRNEKGLFGTNVYAFVMQLCKRFGSDSDCVPWDDAKAVKICIILCFNVVFDTTNIFHITIKTSKAIP